MSSIHKSIAKLGFFKTFLYQLIVFFIAVSKDHLGDQFNLILLFQFVDLISLIHIDHFFTGNFIVPGHVFKISLQVLILFY